MTDLEKNIQRIMQAKKLEADNLLELIVAILEGLEAVEKKLANQLEVVIDEKLIDDIAEKVIDRVNAKYLAAQNTKVNKLHKETELLKQNLRSFLGENDE